MIYQGEAFNVLKQFPDQSINTCVTSPPYWGLRNYNVEGQLGLEDTPEEYVERLVGIFAEVKRVLRDDGTLWLNLGDSYNGSGGAGGDYNEGGLKEGQRKYPGRNVDSLKSKDLVGIPWMVAFALRNDGWYLRNDIIWKKKGGGMPESVTDRCSTSHEHIFLLAKSKQYYYDQNAIKEPLAESNKKAKGAQLNQTTAKGSEKNAVNVQDIEERGERLFHQVVEINVMFGTLQ